MEQSELYTLVLGKIDTLIRENEKLRREKADLERTVKNYSTEIETLQTALKQFNQEPHVQEPHAQPESTQENAIFDKAFWEKIREIVQQSEGLQQSVMPKTQSRACSEYERLAQQFPEIFAAYGPILGFVITKG